MKKALLLLFISGCGIMAMAQSGAWVRKSDIGATRVNGPGSRVDPVGFGLGSKGYVGTGSTGTALTRDFEAYDPTTNGWSARALFGGISRSGAVGFAIGGKGYIGTGADSTVNPWLQDFWEYDSASDTWSQKADFGGGPRTDAVGFSVGSYGYVGTGTNVYGDKNDFWQYDPAANTWTQRANFPGGPRYHAVGFGLGSKGYLGTGNDPVETSTPTFYKDFYAYDPATDTWTQKADFGGGTRALASAFSVGSYGYIGMGNAGIQSDGISTEGQKDLWQYDPGADTWTQKANLPGVLRWSAVGFSVMDKGYIGTGTSGACYSCAKIVADFWQYDPGADNWTQISGFAPQPRVFATAFNIGNKGYLGLGQANDFWQYDSLSDAWTQLADFPGVKRDAASGFGINGKGYVTCGGYASIFNDLWEYDPVSNAWTQKTSLPGSTRMYAFSFVAGNKGYVGTGVANTTNTSFLKDLWEYDPSADSWTEKADFPGGTRYGAVGFAINGKGYAGTGQDTSTASGHLAQADKKDLWQYDPSTDTWTPKADFGGGNRTMATGFSAAGLGFIGTGQSDTSLNTMQDFWQYDPTLDTWTRIPDLPSQGRTAAAAFSLGQAGYAGSGEFGSTWQNDWWEYDPSGTSIRTAIGTYQVSSVCPGIAGSGFTWESDNQGGLVYGVDAGTNNLGATCWGTNTLAAGNYRNAYGWFGGTSKAFGAYLTRNYVLTPSTEPTSDVTVRFYCTAQELSDFVAAFNTAYGTSYTSAEIRVIRYDGANQDLDLTNDDDNSSEYTALTPTIGTYGSSDRYLEVTTSSLSEFAIVLSSSSAPLGFKLLNFTAVYHDPSTTLSWQTTQEENIASFNVERSVDGRTFTTVGTVPAAGQSNTTLDYHFTDATAAQAGSTTLYYRLQETDLDGRVNYSPMDVVRIDAPGVFTVYPNPATDHVFVQVTSSGAAKGNLTVTDVAGRTVVVEPLTLQEGANSLYLATGGWAPGLYYLKLSTDSGSWEMKLLKQ